MESHLVYATNNHSSQYERRFELNSQSYMSESQGFESEGRKSHYGQFERFFHEGSLLFHQQTFCPYSNICYVGNNETVFIQPPSFNGYLSTDNAKQPSMCNPASEALSESSSFSYYNSIYDGARIYPCLEPGNLFDQDGLMNRQRTQCSENHDERDEHRSVFYQSSNLITDRNVHIEENNYRFSECGQVSNQSSQLIQYPSIHTKEEHCKWNKCGKVFPQLSNLNRHRKTHTGGTPNQCTECGKTFSKPFNLTRHLTVHTAEKTCKCTECGKAFTRSSNLNRHR